MKNRYFLIIGIVAIVLIAGIGFLLLHQTKAPTSVLTSNSTNQNSSGRRFGGAGGGGRFFGNIPAGSTRLFGSITNISGSTLTLQGRNGDLTVNLVSGTKYTGGTQTDLKTGDRVVGYGTSNSDKSIDAQQLTINPSFPGRQGGQNPSPQTNSL